MRWKLIAFDLDDTLLDSGKRLPEENLCALCAAAERGVLLVPATGRILRGLPEALRSLPFLRYFILANGAAVYDAAEEKTLCRADIPLELTLEAMRYLDTQPVIYDCYQDEIGWMSEELFAKAPEFLKGEPLILAMLGKLRVRVPDLKQTLLERGEPVQKIQFFYRPEDNDKRLRMLRHFSERFPDLVATSSNSANIELNSVHAGKGNGLLALCRALGIDPSDTVAFGDSTNDISLLRAVGRGVAMANAAGEVKAAADAICESNDNCGVGKEIWRLMGEG